MLKKKILFLLAMASLVTACGGGGDDTPQTTNNPVGGSQTGGGAVEGPPAGSNGGGENLGGDDGVNDNPSPDDTGATPPADQKLNGHLEMVANQLVYIRTNREIFHAVSLTQFESDEGMYDVASGSATTNVPGANVLVPAIAPAAPIAAFGFRVDKHVQASTEDQQVANQTAAGRVAISLTERAGTVGEGEVAESMHLVINGVELSTDANRQITGVHVKNGAQMYVHGRNAANEEASATIPVPEDAVELLSMTEVLDNEGDITSTVLLISLEKAFGSAGQALAKLENMRGQFSMQVTLSPVQIVRPAGTGVEYKDLVGQPITVNGQPTVTGAGISGNVWIRRDPPPKPSES